MGLFQSLAGVLGVSPKQPGQGGAMAPVMQASGIGHTQTGAPSYTPTTVPAPAGAPATPAQQGFLGRLGHLGLHVMSGSQVKDGPGDIPQAQMGQMAQPGSGHFSPPPQMMPAYQPINFQQPQQAQAYHPMQFQALANAAGGR